MSLASEFRSYIENGDTNAAWRIIQAEIARQIAEYDRQPGPRTIIGPPQPRELTELERRRLREGAVDPCQPLTPAEREQSFDLEVRARQAEFGAPPGAPSTPVGKAWRW